jgi:DNA-binding response OmpR family regulator
MNVYDRKRIVVVDDDPDISGVINLMLEIEGYDVQVLSHGMAILNHETWVPDLYIVDRCLPYLNGPDICTFLKANEITKEIPVIIISATKSKKEALAAGAIIFIEKPFGMPAFLKAVSDALLSQ